MDQNHSLYERFSKLYELVFKPFFLPGIKRALNELSKRETAADILEVGVGTGYALEWYPFCSKITGIDISAKMVETSRKRAELLKNRNIKILEKKDFVNQKTKSSSVVVSFSVITVVPDPQDFLNELSSYCKPGGHIYIVMHERSKFKLWSILDHIFDWPCQKLFGFTLLRSIEDLDLKGLSIVEQKVLSRFLFVPYNNLIILKKQFKSYV